MIYECVVVQPYREQDAILDEEGDLDNESDDPDLGLKSRRDSDSVTSSMSAEHGSPIHVD